MRKILILAAIAAAAILAWIYLPMGSLLEQAETLRGHGLQGAIIIGLVYAIATVLMIPGSLITLSIGALYGPWLGVAIVSPASVLGATLAFLLGRGLFRNSIEGHMASRPKFQALAGAMEKQGFKIMTLVRLSPVFPFALVNYAFGLTRVRLKDYILGSFVGMLPGTLMYVYLGSTVENVAELLSGGAPDAGGGGQALQYFGFAVTVALTIWITKIAKRALADAAPEVVTAQAGAVEGAVSATISEEG